MDNIQYKEMCVCVCDFSLSMLLVIKTPDVKQTKWSKHQEK